MAELYYVQPKDSLWKIAKRFGVSIQAIVEANVICNKNIIFVGEPLIIPDVYSELPKAGGNPYYIVQPGDYLWCLSKQFNIPVKVLAVNNQIPNPTMIYPEEEFILVDEIPNPEELKARWELTGGPNCEIYGMQSHGLYVDTFAWAALGRKGVPYLMQLLSHQCPEIRFYALLSLGRIGLDSEVKEKIKELLDDPEPYVAEITEIVLKRIDLVWKRKKKRMHLTLSDDFLFETPNLSETEPCLIAKGEEVVVLKWFIPSPTHEEGPRGGLQIYDYVERVKTGQKGYFPRRGLNEINLV